MDTAAILAAAQSHAAALGWFDRVAGFEPKNAPGPGVSVAYWVDTLRPIPARSGLAATSARLVLSARVYAHLDGDKDARADLDVVRAVDALIASYTAGYTLGGLVALVDVLGQHGDPLAARFGYLNQDGTEFRVAVVTIPLIVNDAWAHAS